MLEVDRNAALAAVGVEKHSAHARRSSRADLPDDVAIRAFHLDDVGAHVGNDLRGIGSHQDGGQIENRKTVEGTHGHFRTVALPQGKVLFLYVYIKFTMLPVNRLRQALACLFSH